MIKYCRSHAKKTIIQKIFEDEQCLYFDSFHSLFNGMLAVNLYFQNNRDSFMTPPSNINFPKIIAKKINTVNLLETIYHIDYVSKAYTSFEFIGIIKGKAVKLIFKEVIHKNHNNKHYQLSSKSFGYIKNANPFFLIFHPKELTFLKHSDEHTATKITYDKKGHLWEKEFFSHNEYRVGKTPRTVKYREHGSVTSSFFNSNSDEIHVSFIEKNEDKIIDAKFVFNKKMINLKKMVELFPEFSHFGASEFLNIADYFTSHHYSILDMATI
jgi:hypothetical protein